MLRKGKQILLRMRHPSCCLYDNKSGKESNSVGHIHEREGDCSYVVRNIYPISFVKRLFHNGQPTRNGVRKIYEGMISTSPFGTLGLIASLWAVTIYQENHDRKCKHGNIVSIGRYIPRMQVLLQCCYLEMESSQLESWNHLFCRKVLFLIDPHCQFLYVSQDMKQT